MNHPNVPDFLTPLPKSSTRVPLPSRGIVYKEGPAKTGALVLVPMTLIEENTLTTAALAGEDGMTMVLKKCIQDHIDPNYLLSADQHFLFMMLRAITYGSDYTFNWTCQASTRRKVCGAKNRCTVHIPDDFQVKYLTSEDVEPFNITLPTSGKQIGFRLQRVYDTRDFAAYDEKMQKDAQSGITHKVSGQAYRLAKLLVSVEGHEITKDIGLDTLINWIISLPLSDLAYYDDRMDYYTPGMDTSVRLECGTCGTIHDMDLPLTPEFFRPRYTVEERPLGVLIRPNVLPGAELRGGLPDTSRGTDVVSQPSSTGEEGRDGSGQPEVRDVSQGDNVSGGGQKSPTVRRGSGRAI